MVQFINIKQDDVRQEQTTRIKHMCKHAKHLRVLEGGQSNSHDDLCRPSYLEFVPITTGCVQDNEAHGAVRVCHIGLCEGQKAGRRLLCMIRVKDLHRTQTTG